jgi:hypothetical protein
VMIGRSQGTKSTSISTPMQTMDLTGYVHFCETQWN